MTPDTRRFSVDLDKLDSLAARIRGFAGFIDDQLKAIDGKAKEAEGHWTGAAATAYSDAHREWMSGAAELAHGLKTLEDAVKHVHEAHTTAVSDNLKILGV